MAQKRVTKDDISEKDPFLYIEKSAVETEKKVKLLEKSLKAVQTTAKTIKGGLGAINPNSTAELRDFNALTQKANATAKAKLKIDKELIVERERLMQLNREIKQNAKDEAILAQKNIGTLEKARVENRKLRREREKLNLNTKEGNVRLKEINKTIDRNNVLIEENADKMKKQRLGIGRYKDAVRGLKNTLTGIGVGLGARELFGGLARISNEQDQINKRLTASFNLQGQALENTRKQVKFLSQAYDTEVNEVLNAATSLTTEFGISQQNAFNLIEKGFAKGANVRGEFLEQLKEYSTQFVNVGLSADEAIAIITQQEQSGVFSDKGVDAIKEAGLRLTELTPAANDALKMIGISGNELQQQITSGQKTVFEATQEISREIAKLPKNSREVGTVLADVFGGAGEDAKGFVLNLGNVSTELDELKDTTTAYEKAKQAIIQRFIDFKDEIAQRTLPILQFLAQNFTTIISLVGQLIKAFIVFKTTMFALKMRDRYLEWRKFGGSIKDATKNLKEGSTSARNFGNALKGIGWTVAISLAAEFAQEVWNIASGANFAAIAVKNLEKATTQGAEKATAALEKVRKLRDEQINQIRLSGATQEEQTKRIQAVNERYQLAIEKEIEKYKALKIASSERRKQLNDEADALKEQLSFYSSLDSNAQYQARRNNALKAAEQDEQYAEILRQLRGELENVNQVVVDGTIDLKEQAKATKLATEETKEYKDALEDIESVFERIREAETTAEIEAKEFQLEDLDKRLEDEKEFTLKTGVMRGNLVDEIIEEERRLQKELIELRYQEELANAETAAERQLAQDRRNRALIRLEEDLHEKRKDNLADLEQAQEDYDANRNRDVEKEEERQKKLKDIINDYGEQVLDGLIERSQRKKQLLDEEIDKQNEVVNNLRSAAAAGNAIATQSLAREEELLEEKERQRRAEAKREIQLEEAKAIMNALNSFLDQGDSFAQATIKAFSASGIIKKLVAGVGFKKGGYTGDGGTDEIAGVTHGQEFVIDAPTTAALGLKGADMGDFKERFVHNAVMYEQFKGINAENTKVNSYSFDTSALENKIENLTKVVAGKPETSIDPYILNGMAQGIQKTVKKGGVTNKYIYHKK